jgi:hypothetical protein
LVSEKKISHTETQRLGDGAKKGRKSRNDRQGREEKLEKERITTEDTKNTEESFSAGIVLLDNQPAVSPPGFPSSNKPSEKY